VELTDFDRFPNLVAMFLDRARTRAALPMLVAKRDGAWQPTDWTTAADQVCVLAQSLRRIGLKDGDRVVLVSENRPEWCIADLAIMAAGLVTVPTYTTNTERDHHHILENSGARAIIVSTAKLAPPLLAAAMRAPNVEHVIGIEPLRQMQSGMLTFHDWTDLTTGNVAMARDETETRINAIGRDTLACIIYTSGTGGAPRGVRQHHGAILRNVDGAAHILAEDFGWKDEVFLSFLPLSHAYEHSAGQFLPIGMGGTIYYAESLEKLAANMEEVHPTIMVVVPRLFEVLRARIMKQVEKQGRLPAAMMHRALAIATRRAAGKAGLTDRLVDMVLEHTLRPKIRQRFGGRMKALVSGGAPLNPEVGIFFEAMGLTLLQGYGQTEAGPVISVNRPRAGVRMDTVGPPMREVTVKIAEDGEILVQGELVMHGYWRNDVETLRTIRDGWLHTGDIGHIDPAGRIVITDRKKDMIVNDKGDNISPQKLEGMLTLQPEIAQAMVSGDKRPYVVGLIVPDAEWALDWAREAGEHFNIAALQDLPAFRAAIRAALDRVNADLSVTEKVRQFAFADEPFAITNEELTPSMKIRRHKIRERYGARVDALYRG
jgi:long-chain acyl-CoA synthetase